MLESNRRVAKVCISMYTILWAIIGTSLMFYEGIEIPADFESKKSVFAESFWLFTMSVSFLVLIFDGISSGFKPKDLLMMFFIHGITLYGVNYLIIDQESFVLILLEVAVTFIIELIIIVISPTREMKASNEVEKDELADVSINKSELEVDRRYRCFTELNDSDIEEGEDEK